MTLTVETAAIRSSVDGKVYTVLRPGRHHDIIRLMAQSGLPTPIDGLQGFVLSNGKFVNRRDAASVARAAGQLADTKWHGTKGPAMLYSEDLW